MSIFKWETLHEIGSCNLQYAKLFPGKMCEIELASGRKVRVWRGDDSLSYFCHGLTFGGKEAPGGPISPFSGKPVETILQEHYEQISEAEAKGGDILVWRGLPPQTTPHSAVLVDPVASQRKKRLDYSSWLRTKNGMLPETEVALQELIELYGETYSAYRKQ